MIALPAALAMVAAGNTPGSAQAADEFPPRGDDEPHAHRYVIEAIAADIEGLKSEYPQLSDFSSQVHRDPERLVIRYGYRTHAASSATDIVTRE